MCLSLFFVWFIHIGVCFSFLEDEFQLDWGFATGNTKALKNVTHRADHDVKLTVGASDRAVEALKEAYDQMCKHVRQATESGQLLTGILEDPGGGSTGMELIVAML